MWWEQSARLRLGLGSAQLALNNAPPSATSLEVLGREPASRSAQSVSAAPEKWSSLCVAIRPARVPLGLQNKRLQDIFASFPIAKRV